MEMRQYERASAFGESRSKTIERAKKGKELYEKRQMLIKKIDQILNPVK